ncbi:MAG: peptidase dimerization domain-containing protein [Alicycliphilus sp.]|jgi:metal-dependent amidase/aminoacylase/carboxypeptidase family protein|uniref:Peptidase dimerization domain-containing protein n=1 Tax=Diaphorobacter limosus TaxID=3036128 RepID=A0ABZ0J7F5_9BURK|nr:peptidase dimerization domain-containing protein [Diaphorobacter sp. Y-1]MBP6751969.1 peptidase dimerization domain-containing protein [Alicycliphilus sp.]MCA0440699.1 peptidase dimerization domain-containing protein [Pseudomonadota bacterium]HRO80264.1 peptidase dimerization domain-containing protein [Alicycliphilus denitrificans]MBP7326821.1 peptidase dimerization domain-containing protein [Alicycliphilus sp.]MBP7327673.1 peptidase dimerization domain-containing protein [Alicycliphilus sp
MTKTFAITLFAASCLMGGLAQAQSTSVLLVEFQGPGGHSSGNYGRTSALHAAARAVIELQKSMPTGSYSVAYLSGGNSVNSIASDGSFAVRLSASAGMTAADFLAKVALAAKSGADAENAFRNVKPGDLTAGAPADIRYSVKQQ